MSAFASSALPVLLAVAGLAQNIAAQEVRFESGVTNIHVDALVERNGHGVRGLTRDDFMVRDEGDSRPLVAFAEESVPLDLVLLMDLSWPVDFRTKDKIVEEIFAGARNALAHLRPNDRCAIISTGGPRLEQDLTADPKAIAAALNRLRSRKRSPGFDLAFRSLGIQWTARLLEADAKARGQGAPERKRAILMITGGGPLVWMPDEPVIRQLWSMDVALHDIDVPIGDWPKPNPLRVNGPRLDNPQHIAKATGGDVATGPQTDIPEFIARIQASYSLWYRAPAAKSGELRHVSVELSDEAKKKYPGAEIRAREGYIAP